MGGIKITQADKWFSLAIREAWNWTCCRCGTQYHHNHRGLDCSHGYSRGHWSVRFSTLNARPHCMGCHRIESGHWMERLLTDWERERLRELRDDVQLAKMYRKTKGKGELSAHWKKQYDLCLQARECGVTGVLPLEEWL